MVLESKMEGLADVKKFVTLRSLRKEVVFEIKGGERGLANVKKFVPLQSPQWRNGL